jgi:hypothetical protein
MVFVRMHGCLFVVCVVRLRCYDDHSHTPHQAMLRRRGMFFVSDDKTLRNSDVSRAMRLAAQVSVGWYLRGEQR